MGKSNRQLVVAFCITLYCWFAFFDDKGGLDPEEVDNSLSIDLNPPGQYFPQKTVWNFHYYFIDCLNVEQFSLHAA